MPLTPFPQKAFSGKFRSASSTVGSFSPLTIPAMQSANSLRARPKGAPGRCLGGGVLSVQFTLRGAVSHTLLERGAAKARCHNAQKAHPSMFEMGLSHHLHWQKKKETKPCLHWLSVWHQLQAKNPPRLLGILSEDAMKMEWKRIACKGWIQMLSPTIARAMRKNAAIFCWMLDMENKMS